MQYKDYTKNDLDISGLQNYLKQNISQNKDEENIIKNYKVMCKLLNEDIQSGSSKKAQVNRWKRYFKFHRDGQRYVIDEIYDEPIISIDGRKLKYFEGQEKFLIPFELRNAKGVYIIQSDNSAYIGSTWVSFIKRFIQHHNKIAPNMSHTRKLIRKSNATFKILYLAKETDTEDIIRQKEADFIQEYINRGYDVINRRTETIIYFNPETHKKFDGNNKKKLIPYDGKSYLSKKYVSKDVQIEYDIKFNKTQLNEINQSCKSDYEIVYISSSSVFMKNIGSGNMFNTKINSQNEKNKNAV